MSLTQAPGPAEGVAGVSGGAAGSGLGAEGGAEHCPAGEDSARGGAQHLEGNQPEPGPQQRSAHQPVPGMDTHAYADSHRCFPSTQRVLNGFDRTRLERRGTRLEADVSVASCVTQMFRCNSAVNQSLSCTAHLGFKETHYSDFLRAAE